MVVRRGQIYWANLPPPHGSGPGYRRPVVVVQADWLNRTRIQTVLAAVMTSNLRHALMPGSVVCRQAATGLPRDSVVNLSQVIAVDLDWLEQRVGMLEQYKMREVDAGLRQILGL